MDAILALIGVVVGAAATLAAGVFPQFLNARRTRQGTKNLLQGVLRDCSVYAYVGSIVQGPLPTHSLELWSERNDSLIANLTSPDVMASVDEQQAKSLWQAANQGSVAIAILLNMAQADNPQAKFAPNVSTSALNHYTNARATLGDNAAAQAIMAEMTKISQQGKP